MATYYSCRGSLPRYLDLAPNAGYSSQFEPFGIFQCFQMPC
jgi:hypothetical protein